MVLKQSSSVVIAKSQEIFSDIPHASAVGDSSGEDSDDDDDNDPYQAIPEVNKTLMYISACQKPSVSFFDA